MTTCDAEHVSMRNTRVRRRGNSLELMEHLLSAENVPTSTARATDYLSQGCKCGLTADKQLLGTTLFFENNIS